MQERLNRGLEELEQTVAAIGTSDFYLSGINRDAGSSASTPHTLEIWARNHRGMISFVACVTSVLTIVLAVAPSWS